MNHYKELEKNKSENSMGIDIENLNRRLQEFIDDYKGLVKSIEAKEIVKELQIGVNKVFYR